MSKITLEPNSSGAGTFSIVSPDSNTNRTLNLPDESGSVLTDVSDIEPQVKTATNASGAAPIYACRVWVSFNGQGTVAINGSGNVSSITDNATGDYTVNFATAMPDSVYAGLATIDRNALSTSQFGIQIFKTFTTSCDLIVWSNGSKSDAEEVTFAAFR